MKNSLFFVSILSIILTKVQNFTLKRDKLRVVAISGSLRKASYNSGIIRACIQINDPDLDIQWADISQFPLYNQDLDTASLPSCIVTVK